MKTIMNINSINEDYIAKAAREAGIRENEKYSARLVSYTDGLAEIILETEWNTVTCYIDIETSKVLGLMAEAKSVDELLADEYRAVRVSSPVAKYRTAA